MSAAAAQLAPTTEPMQTAAPQPPPQENVVLPALRTDLIVTQQMFEGRSYYVVKDPISLQYFRMTAEDYALATLFDGVRTFGQIRTEYSRSFRHVLLEFTPEELNERVLKFANDLALMRFLGVAGVRLKAQYDQMKATKKKKAGFYELANKLFFFRKSIFDPDQLFARMAKPLWWLWTPAFHWVSVALCVAAFVVFVLHAEGLDSAFANLFSWQNVALMWVTTIVIKSIHELGHGLTCKHYGGEVHEIGVMFLVFTPYFFVNISDAWTMPRRRNRILTSAAGIYVELIFAALATFLWAIVQPGLFRDFLFNVIFIASVSTIIFNANPLMRFDGYYILTDVMEVPNLQQKSRALIQHQLSTLLFGRNTSAALSRLPLPRKRFWLFYIYAVLSWVYGYYIIWSLAYYMAPSLEPLGLDGIANWLSGFALFAWVVMPLIAFFKGLGLKRDDWDSGGRLRRLSVIVSVVLGGFIAACFLPVELKIKRAGAVTLAEPEEVRPEVPGFLAEVFVKDGDIVKTGQLLARLSNRDLEQELVLAEARLRSGDADVQRALAAEKLSELKQLETVRDAARTRLTEAERDVKALTLSAKTSGTVLTTGSTLLDPQHTAESAMNPAARSHGDRLSITRDLSQAIGRLARFNDVFCEIGSLDPMRIKVAVSEKQVRWIAKGQRVELKVAAHAGRTFRGTVAEPPNVAYLGEIPPGFSKNYGGDVPAYTDPVGREIPTERTYAIVVEVANPDGLLRPGMSVRGKIYAGRHPWGRLVLQSLRDLVSLDYRF